MKNEKIILKALTKKYDGLGGYIEDYEDKEFFGKVTFAKDKMVITRANDIHTQKLVNMKIIYLKNIFNNYDDLKSIKRGDKLTYNNDDYVVHLVEAYNNMFVVTLLEDF